MAKSKSLPVDDLVKKLLPDAEHLGDIQSIYGFVGPSDSDDHICLFLDIHLSRSLFIRSEDILHSVSIPKSHNPLGGTLIWVKNGYSYINYGSVEQKEEAHDLASQDPYLQGTIYQNWVPPNEDTGFEEGSDPDIA